MKQQTTRSLTRTAVLVAALFRAALLAAVPEPLRENVFFDYDVVAQTGVGGMTELRMYPSINDHGIVAFVARADHGGVIKENVHTWTKPDGGTAVLRPMFNEGLAPRAEGSPPTQTFAADVQINNENLVLARRYLTAIVQIGFPFGSILNAPLSYLELYDATRPNQHHVSQVTMGNGGGVLVTILNPLWAGNTTWGVGDPDLINIASPYDPATPFATVMHWGTINNHHQAIFHALVGSEMNLVTRPASLFIGKGNGVRSVLLTIGSRERSAL